VETFGVVRRDLGRTGLRVSVVAFGAGPVAGLMTGDDADAQRATVARALEAGINWFDTAAGYGEGRSEANLGRVLAELGAAGRVHVATKVRVPPDAFGRVAAYVRESVEASLRRLRLPRVALLQLHNAVTERRGDEPASVSPADVLAPGGIADALGRARDAGLTAHLGLTGTGTAAALREVARSGAFETVQTPYHALNPSAGAPGSADGEADYGNLMADAIDARMGVFAIRVFAGGALLGRPPSAHTLTTPFFPLALYERDLARAERLRRRIAGRVPLTEYAVRFALAHPAVSSAIIGFGSPEHVTEIAGMAFDDPCHDPIT
jgi:aryl-alcohol dehydrogenase-like predicted oxidoreductase